LAVWDKLPDGVQSAILALVDAVCKTQGGCRD
jgi:hypothetical protein